MRENDQFRFLRSRIKQASETHEQVVPDQVDTVVLLSPSSGEQDRCTSNNGQTTSSQESTLLPESSGEPRKEHDDQELNGTERNVEQGSDIVVESQTLDQETTESTGNVCTSVEEYGSSDQQPSLGVPHGLLQVRGLEFLGTGTSLVGSNPLDGNELFTLGQPLGVLDGGGELPEEERTGEDGENGGDDEDELPGFDVRGLDVTDREGHEGTEHGGLKVAQMSATASSHRSQRPLLTKPLVPYQKATRRGCS